MPIGIETTHGAAAAAPAPAAVAPPPSYAQIGVAVAAALDHRAAQQVHQPLVLPGNGGAESPPGGDVPASVVVPHRRQGNPAPNSTLAEAHALVGRALDPRVSPVLQRLEEERTAHLLQVDRGVVEAWGRMHYKPEQTGPDSNLYWTDSELRKCFKILRLTGVRIISRDIVRQPVGRSVGELWTRSITPYEAAALTLINVVGEQFWPGRVKDNMWVRIPTMDRWDLARTSRTGLTADSLTEHDRRLKAAVSAGSMKRFHQDILNAVHTEIMHYLDRRFALRSNSIFASVVYGLGTESPDGENGFWMFLADELMTGLQRHLANGEMVEAKRETQKIIDFIEELLRGRLFVPCGQEVKKLTFIESAEGGKPARRVEINIQTGKAGNFATLESVLALLEVLNNNLTMECGAADLDKHVAAVVKGNENIFECFATVMEFFRLAAAPEKSERRPLDRKHIATTEGLGISSTVHGDYPIYFKSGLAAYERNLLESRMASDFLSSIDSITCAAVAENFKATTRGQNFERSTRQESVYSSAEKQSFIFDQVAKMFASLKKEEDFLSSGKHDRDPVDSLVKTFADFMTSIYSIQELTNVIFHHVLMLLSLQKEKGVQGLLRDAGPQIIDRLQAYLVELEAYYVVVNAMVKYEDILRRTQPGSPENLLYTKLKYSDDESVGFFKAIQQQSGNLQRGIEAAGIAVTDFLVYLSKQTDEVLNARAAISDAIIAHSTQEGMILYETALKSLGRLPRTMLSQRSRKKLVEKFEQGKAAIKSRTNTAAALEDAAAGEAGTGALATLPPNYYVGGGAGAGAGGGGGDSEDGFGAGEANPHGPGRQRVAEAGAGEGAAAETQAMLTHVCETVGLPVGTPFDAVKTKLALCIGNADALNTIRLLQLGSDAEITQLGVILNVSDIPVAGLSVCAQNKWDASSVIVAKFASLTPDEWIALSNSSSDEANLARLIRKLISVEPGASWDEVRAKLGVRPVASFCDSLPESRKLCVALVLDPNITHAAFMDAVVRKYEETQQQMERAATPSRPVVPPLALDLVMPSHFRTMGSLARLNMAVVWQKLLVRGGA